MFEKIIVKLCRKIHEVYFELITIKVKSLTQKVVKYGNHAYELKQRKPTFVRKNVKLYYIDVDTGASLHFNGSDTVLDPEVLEKLINKGFINALTNSLKPMTFTMEVKNIAIGIAIGAPIAMVVMFILMYLGVL